MRSDAPRLLPVLRSQHQADLLTLVLLTPDTDYTITDLAARLAIPQSTVSGEVQRLADAGILRVRPVGRSRLVRANTDSPLTAPLTQLLLHTYGPHVVISQEFADLANVDQVIIYGSWAARYHGEPGAVPHDIDVLVIGAPNRMAMYAAAQHAEERLARPVNPTPCPAKQWAHPTEPLITEIQQRPIVTVVDHGTTVSTVGGAA